MGQLRVAAGLLLVVAAMAGVAPAAPGDGTLAARQHRRLSSRTSRKWQRAALGASLVAAAAAAAAAVALSSAAYFGRSLSDQRPRNVVAFFLAVLLLGADCARCPRGASGAAAYGVLVATIALTLAVNAYVVNVVAFDDRASVLDRFQDPRKAPGGRHHGSGAFYARQCVAVSNASSAPSRIEAARVDREARFQDWDLCAYSLVRFVQDVAGFGVSVGLLVASSGRDARAFLVGCASAASLWCLAGRARRRLRDRRRRLRAARVETPGAEAGPGADFFTGFLRDPRFAAADHAGVGAAADRDRRRRRRRKKRSGRSRRRRSSSSSSGDHSAGGAATDDGGVELLELPGCKGDRGASSV
ncbi:hypothetical protein JL720_13944 [Aureococcus anophagefferens]|nr:hypothetical protein JL720_13944 [Aureococcus anophagefferens]